MVHLSDRLDRLTLLAFPRGRWTGAMFEAERLGSTEGRRRWTLTIRGTRKRVYSLEASMRSLRRPFRPCRVTVGGRRRKHSYDAASGVLRVRFAARRAKLIATRCR